MVKRLVQGVTFPFAGQVSLTTAEGFRFMEDCEDLAELLGRTREELQGKELASFISTDAKDEVVAQLTAQLAYGTETEMLLPLRKKNGNSIFVLMRGILETDRGGTVYLRNLFVSAEKTGQLLSRLQVEVSAFQTKLSQTENRISLLQTRAEQDSLTKVFNAGATRRLVEEYLSKPEIRCAMLIIDIDNFKRINDCYGHMTGDNVMICAANAIKKQFRANDIVGRIGGDEFLVLMKDISDAHIVDVKCSQIIAAFNALSFGKTQEAHMSCSIGAAVSCTDQVVYNAMFLCADEAMYRAKQSGGNSYIVEMCECNDH